MDSYNPEYKIPKTVKEMDADDQPREKAEKFGCGVLSVPELWAIILRTGTPGYPITELCRDLMRDNMGSLHRLERRTRNELRRLKGIGATKSIQVEAVMELIKRYCSEDIPQDECIRQSSQIYSRMRHKIGNLDHEEIWMLLLNRRNQVIREIGLTSGTSTSSIFDTKNAIKLALLENAESIILCHNHPSGSLNPSIQDDKLTRDFKAACDCMTIKLLDHIIVTSNGFYSYRDSSKL
ncbi:MAG: DNA repair protein RadC [Muribaculaceae bacterium]|nr:DNA repair protein RadC [Muribaculaceae bacterium]